MKTKRTKKPERRTLFFTVRKAKLIDHTTGELLHEVVGVLVPRDGLMRRYMRERGYHVGAELKGDLRKDRGYQQFRVAHGLGLLCIEQIERFAEFGKDAHAALKALQRESGIACEVTKIDAKPIVDAVLAAAGQYLPSCEISEIHHALSLLNTIEIADAKSLAYDAMEAGEFTEVFDALCRHVLKTYWPDLDEEEGKAKIQKWIGENV